MPYATISRTRSSGPGHSALRRGRYSEPGRCYLITTTTCNRRFVFADLPAAACAAACFEDPRLLGTNRMLAWVLMPDHAHFLLELGAGQSLAHSVSRLKSGSSRRVNACIGSSGALWAHGYHDHAVRSDEQLEAAARYLIANPVRAGIVDRVEEYPFWKSIWC